MTVWHQDRNNEGDVVELHGNVKHLVCPSCDHVAEARPGDLALLKKCLPRMCPSCHKEQLRFKIMLYDDQESKSITPEDVYDRLEEDCKIADLIIWVGISFEQVLLPMISSSAQQNQPYLAMYPDHCSSVCVLTVRCCLQSASVEYFRTARRYLMDLNRLDKVQQAIINPCESASFNLLTAVGNATALRVMKVLMPADDAMDAVSNAVSAESNPEKLAAIYEHLQASADESAREAALLEEAAQAKEAASLSNSAPLFCTTPAPACFFSQPHSYPGVAVACDQLLDMHDVLL